MKERLLEAAERFLDSRLWEKIDEDEVFAIRLTEGNTGFAVVCGPDANGGKGLPESGCASLELYVGDLGIESMLDAHVYTDVFDKSEFAGFEKYFSKKCLIFAAGDEGEPRFVKAMPYRGRQEISDEAELELIYEALLAALALAENGEPEKSSCDAGSSEPESIDTNVEGEDEIEQVPLFEKNGEGFALAGLIDLPEPYAETEVRVDLDNNIMEELLTIPQEGSWECEMIFVPEPKQIKAGEPPYYEHMLMLVNNSTGASLVSEPFRDYRSCTEKPGQAFIKLLQLRKVRPEAIIARDDRTFDLLEPVCKSLEIDLSETQDLPILDAVQHAILHQDKEAQKKAEEEFEKFIDNLCEMSDEVFAQLPPQVLDEVKVLLEMGVITGERAEIIRKRL